METERNGGKVVCPGELHVTPCDYEQYLELQHPVEDPHHLVDGVLVLRATVVGQKKHRQVTTRLGSVTGRN